MRIDARPVCILFVVKKKITNKAKNPAQGKFVHFTKIAFTECKSKFLIYITCWHFKFKLQNRVN